MKKNSNSIAALTAIFFLTEAAAFPTASAHANTCAFDLADEGCLAIDLLENTDTAEDNSWEFPPETA